MMNVSQHNREHHISLPNDLGKQRFNAINQKENKHKYTCPSEHTVQTKGVILALCGYNALKTEMIIKSMRVHFHIYTLNIQTVVLWQTIILSVITKYSII